MKFLFRSTTAQVRGLRQGFQTQAPPHGAPSPPLRGEALPVPKVLQEVREQHFMHQIRIHQSYR